MRLTNGYLFPIPVPLPVDEDDAARLKGETLNAKDQKAYDTLTATISGRE